MTRWRVADHAVGIGHPHVDATDSVGPVVIGEGAVKRGVEQKSDVAEERRSQGVSGRGMERSHLDSLERQACTSYNDERKDLIQSWTVPTFGQQPEEPDESKSASRV